MVTESPAPKDVDEAIWMLQANPPKVRKKKDGQVGQQKTKYADLVEFNETVLAALNRLGVAWICEPTLIEVAAGDSRVDLRFVLKWELKHLSSDTKRTGIYPLMGVDKPQGGGSAITYARRYALGAVTGIAAEEDDDDGAGGMAQRANARQRPAQPAGETAQRAAPALRAERARPAQQPEVPQPQRPARTEAPNPDGPKVNREQQQKMFALWNELGYTGDENRDKRLTISGKLIGREISSSNDLSKSEAHTIINKLLEKTGQPPQPEPAVERPPAKKAARKSAPPARSRAEQITGTPDPSAGPAPWEDDGTLLSEPPADDDWPTTAAPGGES